MNLEFIIPLTHTLSANGREHYHEKAKKTKRLRVEGAERATYTRAPIDRGSKVAEFQRAHLTVHIGWPDNRRRDDHNIIPTLKALIDGCVDANLISDDDSKHLIGPDLRTSEIHVPGCVFLAFTFEESA